MSDFLLFDQPPSWQTPAMTNTESIRKLDVAKRQLIQAILLFLQGRDTVSVHTLAAAAHQILSDIAIANGKDTIIKNSPRLTRDPVLRTRYFRYINEAFNFMKHADRNPDPNAVLTFRPQATPFFILDAILIFREFSKEIPWELCVFTTWYNFKYPDTLLEGEGKDFITNLLDDGLNPDDLEVFYELAINGPPERG